MILTWCHTEVHVLQMSSGSVEDECSPVVLDQNTTLSVKKKDSQTDEEIKLEKLE